MQKAGVALFLAVLVLTAQTPAPKPPAKHSNFLISRAVPDPAAVARGQKVFVASCGFCHGSKANGGENGPDLVRSPIALRDEHGDSLGPVILKGRPEKGMPAFAMTDAQIKDIAAFLRSRQQAAIDRSTYAIQNVVTGDPHKGQEYFNGAGQCATCHSATGDLKGIARKFDPVALQSRFLYPERPRGARRAGAKTKPVPVTVTTASGEKISGNLEYLDDFDVALRDAAGDYHSFTRGDAVRVDVQDPLAGHQKLLKQYTDADIHNLLAYLVTLK